MNDTLSSMLENWVPYKLTYEEGRPYCEWLYTGDRGFTEPFFDETISICRQLYYRNRKSVSSIEILPQWSNEVESVPPAAFIFHVSRCGSTLASQLLALDKSNIVLSEVPFFDALLRKGVSGESLKAAIGLYARVKKDRKRLFIKTDSWHMFFYKQIRELYPTTPFILIYRRPDEVMRSQQKRRGMHAVPALIEPSLFGLENEEVHQMTQDEYLGLVLDRYFQAFLDIIKNDPLAVPVNYNEGPMSMVERIAAVTNTFIGSDAIEKIKTRAMYHAKYPEQVFMEEALPEPVPAYCRAAYDKYEALEKMRNS